MLREKNYYPLTRINYPVTYTPLENWWAKYVICMEVAEIEIICNVRNDIQSIEVKWDKEYDKTLYLSLKRFKGKIAWKHHFKNLINY
jgi:hypothetical protein